jgi:hypothetical protein
MYSIPIALVALGGAAAAFLAKETGEPLAESVRRAGDRVGEHPEQGDTAFVLAVALAVACTLFALWQHSGAWLRERFAWLDRLPVPFGQEVALYIVTVPIACAAIWTMIVAGHSGATLVWKTNR